MSDSGLLPRQCESGTRRWLGSITTKILVLNLLALFLLVGGLFYLDEIRDGLIDAKIVALQTEGEIIAGALGEAPTTPRPFAPPLCRALAVPRSAYAAFSARTSFVRSEAISSTRA